uniref:Wax synthase domain-containing protein n=1 Tax=Cyclophora tenuis TaxID=216820 RepID=A0A6U1R9U0_CYCTE|mmetsp:Transcript_23176/g.39382  ORF Transcript_23176/g.39382 Transcript_23176/m.39382 type:complete len:162 (+) Transcript_23176:1-486(+)
MRGNSPMFQSSSPADFWGRQWNRLVHTGLKNGVYKPVRKYTNSQWAATIAAFLMSGLLHEYVWQVLFYVGSFDTDLDDTYRRSIGKSMLFFGWNGILIVIEDAVVGRERWNAMVKPFPKVLVSLCVILTALPVVHLFTGDIVEKGYMMDLSASLPLIRVSR